MRDLFEDDEEITFTEEHELLKPVNGVFKVIKIDDELKVLDLDEHEIYSLKKKEDEEKIEEYLDKLVYLRGKADLGFNLNLLYATQNFLTKKLNQHSDLDLPYTIIGSLLYVNEYECTRIIDTMVDCINHKQTSVSKLSYKSCSILTKWLLTRVEQNKTAGKDLFDDIYLPSGNQMNEEIYSFFIENENYSKENLRTLAEFFLYVDTERVIEIKKDFHDCYDYYAKKYPESKYEIIQILHYLYGLNRNRDNKFKNILFNGQNIEHLLSILYEMAHDLEIPIFELSLSSLGDGGDLIGHNPTYSGAMKGRLVENYLKMQTTGAIVILKRLDDLSSNTTNHTSVSAVISELLNHRILCENYLRYDFDIRTSFIVGTCLDENNLNADLASYFYTIVPEKKHLDSLKNMILKEFDHIVPDSWDYAISDEVIDLIALRTLVDPFGDAYKKYCFLIVNYILNERSQTKVIDFNFVKDIFQQFLVDDEVMNEFVQHYSDYDEQIRKKMSSYLIELKKNDDDHQKKIKQKMSYLKCCHATKPNKIDLEETKRILNQTHCGLEHVKEALFNAFYQYNHTPSCASHLMFYSSLCGIGKTSIAIDACKAAKLEVVRINCAQINDLPTLYGTESNPGLLLSKIKELNTTTIPLLLDEFEKCHPIIQNSLLNLADTSNASFYSPYLESNIPIQCGFIIATTNDFSKVSEALCDRFKVLEFNPYSLTTKKQIIQHKIIPSLQEQFHSNLSVQEDIIIDYLASHPFSSIREIEMDYRQAYVKALRNQSFVTFELPKKQSMVISNTTNALGVVGPSGNVTHIECLLDDTADQLMGNCKELFQEEFKVVLKHMRHANYLKDEKVFMNLYGNAYPKDGKSAGLAIFASIYGQMKGIDLKEYGFTGEVTLMGHVEKIGGLYFKLLAAKQSGLKKVVIPKANQSEYFEMMDDLKDLTVYFVDHTSELEAILC